MISLMYRLHKSLPAPNKVSSLYVFDSIARAAYRQKSKKVLVVDLNSADGNAATFLVRLEGILDGLVEDMLAHGPPEAKVSRVYLSHPEAIRASGLVSFPRDTRFCLCPHLTRCGVATCTSGTRRLAHN
jgi:hypothetical protein